MSKLGALDFTDLYIRLDSRGTGPASPSRFAPTPRRGVALPRNMQVPDDYESEIDQLRAVLSRQDHDDFAIDLEDMRMRGSRCNLFGEQMWVALRRLPLDPPNLEDLGFRPEILSQFRSWGTRGGLILVGGSTRAGKTTTMVGMLCDYMKTHGGVAYTVEDPVEYYLQGPHGDGGFCFQRQVHRDEEWGEAVKTALRWAPRYISLGEIRTPAAVKWLLRAATSGHLAMCTVHGGSIEETLSAILQIAQSELGETAAGVLADGLCAVIHQSIVQGRPNVHVLSTDPIPSDPVRVAIRGAKLQQLGTVIEQQSILRKQGRTSGFRDQEDDEEEGSSGPPAARAAAKPLVARPAGPRPQAGRSQAAGTTRPVPPRRAPEPPKKKFFFF